MPRQPRTTTARTRRTRTTTQSRVNLSQNKLTVNFKKCTDLDWSLVEDFVRALTGDRDYQYQAIKTVMMYLWGGAYNTVQDLARESWSKSPAIQSRFVTIENFCHQLPLSDRLSGTVYMATGTGKSYVMYAVAYLSIVLGLTSRVLVLGPQSTIIEKGLNEKFRDLMQKQDLIDLLPPRYRGKVIELMNNNDAIVDDCIVIENVNAIYRSGGILDTFTLNADEVLVLSDEVHHAYSHLKYNDQTKTFEPDDTDRTGKETDEKKERLWMKFIRETPQITRHIGFTGTPYNDNEYFADLIFEYSIRTAKDEGFIKTINPLLKVQTDDGQFTRVERFELIYRTHEDNKEKFSYKKQGVPRIKPITIFICNSQQSAAATAHEFKSFLLSQHGDVNRHIDKRVICVISNAAAAEYQPELENIEELNATKVGGQTEYIFAVNKLSEGWDVDNVFQIVPNEDKVFKSRLLIAQVLGRGLRLPRKVSKQELLQTPPVVTVTNHERFSTEIEKLLEDVMESDILLKSSVISDSFKGAREVVHFPLHNLDYIASRRIEEQQLIQDAPQKLKLNPQNNFERITVTYTQGERKMEMEKEFVELDVLAMDISGRFERRRFEFREQTSVSKNESARELPDITQITTIINSAMNEQGILGNKLTLDNKRNIELYFNQYLPRGSKRRVVESYAGHIHTVSTSTMATHSTRIGELDRDSSVFTADSWRSEVDSTTTIALEAVIAQREKQLSLQMEQQLNLFYTDALVAFPEVRDRVTSLVPNDPRSPYVVIDESFKTPVSLLSVSHIPERDFVIQLIKFSEYWKSWVKSPDVGFYSLQYSYWKEGKDKVVRSFNPDFFILQNIREYRSVISRALGLQADMSQLDNLEALGYTHIVRVVEIKSDDDKEPSVLAREEAAQEHFKLLNEKIIKDITVTERYYYDFILLRPHAYQEWFNRIEFGQMELSVSSPASSN
jgi:type III restriction enzyme